MKTFFRKPLVLTAFLFAALVSVTGQNLSDFRTEPSGEEGRSSLISTNRFNGYTNHWQNYYYKWHRYGNMFKLALPETELAILQSKIDIAEDMGIPGLLMQEGFISALFGEAYSTVEDPSPEELEKLVRQEGNILVITDPSGPAGRILEEKADGIFRWAEQMNSYQLDDIDLEVVKAFFLKRGNSRLFVISSGSAEKKKQLLSLINRASTFAESYKMYKGWHGINTTLYLVTCSPGHPLELIGKGMNEGNSWFIFDGYIAPYGKEKLEDWVKEVDLPVVANTGYSPVFGCSDYEGLQVQNYMASRQYLIDYAHSKGGYAFREVFDPAADKFRYDGYFVHPGNKEQIDNENVPFILKSGNLSDNLTSSMVLFIEKDRPLSNESIWDAIMNRRAVAVLEKANMMGPAEYRNVLGLLYLDRIYLEEYFGDNLDITAEVDGYNLIVTMRNYSSLPVTGNLEIVTSDRLEAGNRLKENISLPVNKERQFTIPLQPLREAMGNTNPVAVHFRYGNRTKSTVTLLDMPPAISVNQLLYGHSPEVHFPVTVHNFSENKPFPVEISVFRKDNTRKAVFRQSKMCEAAKAEFATCDFNLRLGPGDYIVRTNTLGMTAESQLGVGRAQGKTFVYEIDLNSDGIPEYRMENDSVRITLLRTGARVIEYIVKSRNDNVLFRIWPQKNNRHDAPYRMRGYYPYGGFEDFLGQASMETHRIYDAKIIQKEGDYVQVEMETDYYGNHLKKIFTLYGNSPLLEVRFELKFKNTEANMLGPQPILELGKTHGPEDVFMIPAKEGLQEYRMLPEQKYGWTFDLKEGWNAGYDTMEDIAFAGAFPVTQPLFLHMYFCTPGDILPPSQGNIEAPHYYVEFQPWIRIPMNTVMYFTYYLWGSGGPWENAVEELRKRNLITVR